MCVRTLQFVRTVSSLSSQGTTVAAMMKLIGWQRCVIVTSTQTLYLLTSASWNKQLESEGIEV